MSGMKHCFTYILYSVFQNKTKKTSVNLYIYISMEMENVMLSYTCPLFYDSVSTETEGKSYLSENDWNKVLRFQFPKPERSS